MDPYEEQRLRDEVIYLHSLWHQGPPFTKPISGPKRKLPQQPPNPPNKLLKPNPPSNSDAHLPKTNSGAGISTRSDTAEDKGTNFTLKLQHNAANAFKEFLDKSGDNDSKEEEEDYWVGNGDEKYQFFLRVLLEDCELRKYYQENCEKGEFCCLVCYGLGKKNCGRKFKTCLGFVQHLIAVSKNESCDSHRALAMAICRVLGWDFDKLPVVVLKGEPLGKDVIKNGEIQVSTSKWPCEKPVDNSSSSALEWRPFESSLASTKSVSAANSVSAEDQARLTIFRSQHVAIKACQNYFERKSNSDCSEDEDESEDEDSTEVEEQDASKDSKLFTFFLNLFKEEDGKLRDFYIKNWEAGEFFCLVCGGIGKKVGKRYKDCVALVQHSTAISKTKKKLAHRAYGRVVCQILGWDINRLPSIVSKGDEALGQPSRNPDDMEQGKLKEDFDPHNEVLIVLDKDYNEVIVSENDSSVHQNETKIKGDELPSANSPAQSSEESAELQQGHF